jgi:hypothetical protein
MRVAAARFRLGVSMPASCAKKKNGERRYVINVGKGWLDH